MSVAASMPMRIVIGASALWAVVCVTSIAWNAVRDPMAARSRALGDRLSAVRSINEPPPESDRAPLKDQRAAIVQKAALWKALVAPPSVAEASPDLLERLKGVEVTRQQVMRGDAVNVRYRMSIDDKQAHWLSVGTTVNGLTVKAIRPDAVVFSLQQGGKEHTVELHRK